MSRLQKSLGPNHSTTDRPIEAMMDRATHSGPDSPDAALDQSVPPASGGHSPRSSDSNGKFRHPVPQCIELKQAHVTAEWRVQHFGSCVSTRRLPVALDLYWDSASKAHLRMNISPRREIEKDNTKKVIKTKFFLFLFPECIQGVSVGLVPDSAESQTSILDFVLSGPLVLVTPDQPLVCHDDTSAEDVKRFQSLAGQRSFSLQVPRKAVSDSRLRAFCAAASGSKLTRCPDRADTGRPYQGKVITTASFGEEWIPYGPAPPYSEAPATQEKGKKRRRSIDDSVKISKEDSGAKRRCTEKPWAEAKQNLEQIAEAQGCQVPFASRELHGALELGARVAELEQLPKMVESVNERLKEAERIIGLLADFETLVNNQFSQLHGDVEKLSGLTDSVYKLQELPSSVVSMEKQLVRLSETLDDIPHFNQHLNSEVTRLDRQMEERVTGLENRLSQIPTILKKLSALDAYVNEMPRPPMTMASDEKSLQAGLRMQHLMNTLSEQQAEMRTMQRNANDMLDNLRLEMDRFSVFNWAEGRARACITGAGSWLWWGMVMAGSTVSRAAVEAVRRG
ncbi:hypothetical protein VM1G_11222 [Cytospora mali]|uniref:Uncharacterized protein n=1 Tax=Cytospora mali TaxID=578113 RepID=A0A194VKN4_CYTMA|nr:hypothetical protein VM1G_11222 [Valsa mali]